MIVGLRAISSASLPSIKRALNACRFLFHGEPTFFWPTVCDSFNFFLDELLLKDANVEFVLIFRAFILRT